MCWADLQHSWRAFLLSTWQSESLKGMFDGKNPPPPALGWIFIVVASILILLGWTMAICITLAGRKLALRKARIYCIVVAGIECMMMPLGTILGVFTLILLTKDSVKQIFEPSPVTPPPLKGM
jgi:hypothetical protein